MPRLKEAKTLTTSVQSVEPKEELKTLANVLESDTNHLKLIENKQEQMSNSAAAIQQIHVISSDEECEDEAAMSVISNSGSHGSHMEFAGFPSPGTANTSNTLNTLAFTQPSPNFRKKSRRLQGRSGSAVQCKSKANFGVAGSDLRKRSSLQTWQDETANLVNHEELEFAQVTPVKRKREKNKNTVGGASETIPATSNIEIGLQTPPPSQQYQIVEVNSNSTTNSLKQKRLLRRSAQNLYINTKCSTESSSEFPVSSPSNPQQPGCSKFLQRPPMLKNTLPADSFERHLAMITLRNPQMTLDDKMKAWQCDPELSDVEDVNTFDDLFQRCEENKRKTLKGTKNKQPNATKLKENYDFSYFRNVILKNLKSKLKLSAQEQRDRPTTSLAVGAAVIAQRRSKAVYSGGDGIEKRRNHTQKKKTQSSTTPPPASSSSTSKPSIYSDDIVENSHALQHHLHKKFQPSKSKVLVYEKVLCPSSSEASQGSKREMDLEKTSKNKSNLKIVNIAAVIDGTAAASTTSKTKLQEQKSEPLIETGVQMVSQNNTPPLNLHWTSTDEDSVFRLNRLNPEIDKSTSFQKIFGNKHNKNGSKNEGIIEMRLDFLADKNELNLKEKKDIFKTPNVPQKYQIPSPKTQTNQVLTLPIVINNSENISPKNSSISKSPEKDSIKLPSEFLGASPVQQFGFHQQHEFCSYLGLTGMSTANAVANAVAELAKCNLARRSLRVRRLQHEQEKQCKDTKERKLLEDLRGKQMHEIKQRENSKQHLKEEIDVQIASTNNKKSIVEPLQESEKSDIKLICHISADKKKNVQDIPKAFIKNVTEPTRKTLMQHLKRGRTSLDTSTLPRSSHSGTEEPDEDSSSNNIHMTNTPVEIQSNKGLSLKEEVKGDKPECNETLSQPNTPKKQQKFECDEYLLQPKISTKQENLNTQSLRSPYIGRYNSNDKMSKNVRVENKNINLYKQDTTHSEQVQKLHTKFQEYLQESRRAKPSIFIVQSINNDKDNKNHDQNAFVEKNWDSIKQEKFMISLTDEKEENVLEVKPQHEDVKHNSKPRHNGPSSKVISKRKAKSKLRKLLTRSVLNLSQQRQLRSRKIVILKTTVKRETVTAEQRTTPKQHTNFKTIRSANHILQESTHSQAIVGEYRKKLSESVENEKTLSTIMHSETLQSQNEPNREILNKYVPLTEATMNLRLIELTGEYEQQQKQLVEINLPVPMNKTSENDIVVVSSTTNCYDETKEVSTTYDIGADGVQDEGCSSTPREDIHMLKKENPLTKDEATQCFPSGIHYWSTASSLLSNPLKTENGKVLHIYYELDILIVIQELLVSFWKYSKLLNVLNIVEQQQMHSQSKQHQQQQREVESTSPSFEFLAEWLHLGECKHLVYDTEIAVSYSNRICVHNSFPIYVEMRCKELNKERRDCNLLSLYVNIYYYNDEDMQAKIHSIQLDSVQSLPQSVIYTTITDSRYFVMSWPQENMLGKKRSGLCKYSFTPHLDTLASIREFKSLRHEIFYLECTDDDKLLGFGTTQLTIWDHRSGDVLMNYDLDINIGRNLGSVFYPSLEIGQNNMIVIFQFLTNNPLLKDDTNIQCLSEETSSPATPTELHVIACNISHVSPSYRVLYKHVLPSPTFKEYKSAINTGDHLIINAPSDEEIWLNCSDPRMLTFVPAQYTQRFYMRGRSQLIEMTDRTLTVNSLSNHVLKIVAAQQ